MLADYVRGESANSVGKRFNVSLDNVRYHAKKFGLWPGGKRIEPIEKRFWRKVRKSDNPKDCWVWLGGFFPNGYACFSIHSESIGAHRMAYELSKGPIPLTLTIDHLCFNKGCVNPDHLEVVTGKENTQRWHRLRAKKVLGKASKSLNESSEPSVTTSTLQAV